MYFAAFSYSCDEVNDFYGFKNTSDGSNHWFHGSTDVVEATCLFDKTFTPVDFTELECARKIKKTLILI